MAALQHIILHTYCEFHAWPISVLLSIVRSYKCSLLSHIMASTLSPTVRMRDQSEGGEYESDDGEHGHYRHGSMDCSSGEDGGSADEEPIGNQQADYSQLERVMGSQQKARGAIPA